MKTVALLDDNNRYWEVDVELLDGSPDIFYDERVLPGDEARLIVLGGRVELKTRSGNTKRMISVGPDKVEHIFSDTKLLRAL